MGNQQMYGKRCAEADQYGNVFLDLDADTYTAGDNVTGTVHVNIKRPYPGDKLCIKIKGREHTRWIDIINKSVQKPDGTFENHQEKIPREEELMIIKQEIVIYDWARNQILNPGQFSFPIAFKIPNGLPGTFFYGAGELAAEVRYGIEAFIQPENPSMAKIKHKREITLREPIQSTIQSREVAITKEVKTGCCCSSQGTVSVKTSFQKDAYAPSEVANILAEVDNSKCSINISDIQFQLSHSIQLRSQGSHRGFNYVISSTSLGSILAGQGFTGDQRKQASIQLPAAQIGTYKDFKGGHVQSYQYDHNKSITPSTHGNLVKSNYSLQVICLMDGCLCCDTNPAVYLPIQIYSIVQRPVQKPSLPPNWQPTVMPPANITVNIINQSGGGNQSIQISMGNNMGNASMPQQQQNVNININNSQSQPQPQAQPQQQFQQQQQQPQPQYNQTQPPQQFQQQQPTPQPQYNQTQPPQQFQQQQPQPQYNQTQPPQQFQQQQPQPQYNQTQPPQQFQQQQPQPQYNQTQPPQQFQQQQPQYNQTQPPQQFQQQQPQYNQTVPPQQYR